MANFKKNNLKCGLCTACFKKLFVFFKIPFDIGAGAFFGIKDSEMSLTENIRVEIQQFPHGFFPDVDIGFEILVKRSVDILAEKNPLASPVQIKRNGTGRVAGRMQAMQCFTAES